MKIFNAHVFAQVVAVPQNAIANPTPNQNDAQSAVNIAAAAVIPAITSVNPAAMGAHV